MTRILTTAALFVSVSAHAWEVPVHESSFPTQPQQAPIPCSYTNDDGQTWNGTVGTNSSNEVVCQGLVAAPTTLVEAQAERLREPMPASDTVLRQIDCTRDGRRGAEFLGSVYVPVDTRDSATSVCQGLYGSGADGFETELLLVDSATAAFGESSTVLDDLDLAAMDGCTRSWYCFDPSWGCIPCRYMAINELEFSVR